MRKRDGEGDGGGRGAVERQWNIEKTCWDPSSRERERENKYQVKVLKKPVSNDVLKMFKIWFIPSLVWIVTL